MLVAIKDRDVSDHLIKKINALVAGQTSFKGDDGDS
jgi:hypothetical protein